MPPAAAVSTVVTKPIPALYTVYILRSTMRRASFYIGSTPDPPRRLKQHNGDIKGGAVRTSRDSLRPWEMVALVAGFPGSVAALKFEWALTNPHLSLHIPSGERLSVARQKKGKRRGRGGGRPRRPPATLQSIVANLHLLLGVPSFARWPLRLHVFAAEVLGAWKAWLATADRPKAAAAAEAAAEAETKTGIQEMAVDYMPLRDYVDKARDVFAFERQGDCVVCHTNLPRGQDGLFAVCPNASCESVGHLRCWSGHLISQERSEEEQPIVPVRGQCPACGGAVVWADMMKELTLRLRAPKEVDKLVKNKRKQEKADAAVAEAEADADANSVVEILSDSGSQAESPRARKTVKAKTAAAKTAKAAATKTAKTTTKSTKAAAKKAPKAKTTVADKDTKITKTARVTKRKDATCKTIDA